MANLGNMRTEWTDYNNFDWLLRSNISANHNAVSLSKYGNTRFYIELTLSDGNLKAAAWCARL